MLWLGQALFEYMSRRRRERARVAEHTLDLGRKLLLELLHLGRQRRPPRLAGSRAKQLAHVRKQAVAHLWRFRAPSCSRSRSRSRGRGRGARAEQRRRERAHGPPKQRGSRSRGPIRGRWLGLPQRHVDALCRRRSRSRSRLSRDGLAEIIGTASGSGECIFLRLLPTLRVGLPRIYLVAHDLGELVGPLAQRSHGVCRDAVEHASSGRRRTRGNHHQCAIAQDVAGRLVLLARHRVAPEMETADQAFLLVHVLHLDALLRVNRSTVPPLAPERAPPLAALANLIPLLLGVDSRGHLLAELKHILDRLGTALLHELLAQTVKDIDERVRVVAGVVEHFFGQWADAPVGKLETLVGVKVAVAGHEIVEPMRGEEEDIGGMVRVEQVDEVEAQVALEP